MNLVYIHYVGQNFEGNHIYEFLFSKDCENVWGEDWDANPANDNPKPPTQVDTIGRFASKIYFEVIQDSTVFCMQDAKDGLIALAWEDLFLSDYEDLETPDKKLFFKFGEPKESVDSKFYERDLCLTYIEKNFLTK